MPGAVLKPASAGFFGKLPSTGDFVTRGLPDAFRNHWDRWISRYLAPRLKGTAVWPPEGLRFRLASGGRVAAGLILPGMDSAGRQFPLSLVLIAEALPDPGALDQWCDAALARSVAALNGDADPDELWDSINQIAPPSGDATGLASFLLWRKGGTAEPTEPTEPSVTLDRLLVETQV
ncbi:MAG: type VI secretion system-associated protein TagF [Paracoccaceae bacterium]|nr:type VI secretion system-associated protein TagF [Paracoccaceae bacterium]